MDPVHEGQQDAGNRAFVNPEVSIAVVSFGAVLIIWAEVETWIPGLLISLDFRGN